MSAPHAKPDYLWDLAVDLYEEERSSKAVAERITEETDETASATWVRKVLHERGVDLQANGFPDALKDEAQHLVDQGYTNEEAAEWLSKKTDRPGPSPSWVSLHTERPDAGAHVYERHGRRTFEYDGPDGPVEIEIRGPVPAETCIEILDRYAEGVPPKVLREDYDVGRGFVNKLTARAGIRRNYSEARINRLIWEGETSPIARRREVERLYTQEEKTIPQIADRVGKSPETIRQDLKARGVERRPRALSMILRSWESLDEYKSFARRVYIETEHKGRPVTEVAEEEGVTESVVNTAKTWWTKMVNEAGSVTELLQEAREEA